MGQRSSKGAVDGPGFSTDVDLMTQVRVSQPGELVLEDSKSISPHVFEFRPRARDCLEFGVTVSPGLFAIAGHKIGKPGCEISADMLNEDGYGIAVGTGSFV